MKFLHGPNETLPWNGGGYSPLYPFSRWENCNFRSGCEPVYPLSSAQGLAHKKHSPTVCVNAGGLKWPCKSPKATHPSASFGKRIQQEGGLPGWAVNLRWATPDFRMGRALGLPRGLPLCMFGAPRPLQGFTSPAYSEMSRFYFCHLAGPGPLGSLKRRRSF